MVKVVPDRNIFISRLIKCNKHMWKAKKKKKTGRIVIQLTYYVIA